MQGDKNCPMFFVLVLIFCPMFFVIVLIFCSTECRVTVNIELNYIIFAMAHYGVVSIIRIV
jgi:hypothetical protein